MDKIQLEDVSGNAKKDVAKRDAKKKEDKGNK